MFTKDRITLIIVLTILVITLGLAIYLINDLIPLFREVMDNTNNESIAIADVEHYGADGPILLGLLQMIQVFSIIIPGPPVTILCGLVLGTWVGGLVSMTGVILGNFTVFYLVRTFRRGKTPFIDKYTKNKFFTSISAYKDQHPRLIIFILYLIPIIPNGVLPYIFANTKIRTRDYLISLVLGTIPGVFLLTFLGQTIADENYTITLIITGIIFTAVGLFLLFKNNLLKHLHQTIKR